MARKKAKHWADGKPVSRHRGNPFNFFVFTWLFLLGAALLGGISVMAFVIKTSDDPRFVNLMASLCGIAAIGLVVWGVVRYALMVKSVDVFAEGVAWSGGAQEAAWEEITAFYRFEYIYNGQPAWSDVRIETEDGRKAAFNMNLSKWKDLADRIQEEAFRVLFPKLRDQYEAGEEVEFGRVSISQEGLTFKGDFIPWKQLKKVGISNGHFCIYEKGKSDMRALRLDKIPNYSVLIRLVDLSPIRKR